MMTFGWRPQESCYRAAGDDSAVCSRPTWFYILLGLAVVGGLSGKKKAAA